MSDKPKTAVQWLLQRIPLSVRAELVELGHEDKALAMERENTCKFATRYEDYCWRVSQNNRYDTPMTAEQYYTETYGESPITNP
jgi:hypothetical protein